MVKKYLNPENIGVVIDIASYIRRKSLLELLIITPVNCSIRALKY